MKKRSTGMQILQHMGFVGSTLSTSSIIPRADTPAGLQKARDDFFDSGRVADPDVWQRYANIQKRPSTLETQLQLWDEMSAWDLITAALVEITEEVCQTDNTNPDILWYECNNRTVQEELNSMLDVVNAEQIIPSQAWHISALGNDFEFIDYARGDGVRGLSFIHPFDIRRYWLERNRQCVGFRWRDRKPNKEDVFVMPDNTTPIERVGITNGTSTEDLWYPWDILHMRRMGRLRGSEHGEPLFDEAQGIYKKLRLALDQMVVFRAQIQPDRYVVNIDTQDLPPSEQILTVQRWKRNLRTKQTYGLGNESATLNTPEEFRAFYNPWALDTIFYMAQPKNVKHSIEKLQGTAQVPDVFDIELLIDLFFSIIGMQKSWFGLGSQESAPPSGKSLLAQDIRFLRKAKSIRKPIINSYQWLGYFHALLKGYDIRTLNIQARMPDIGGLEDQMKLDLLKTQGEILSLLGDVMTQYNLPKEAWVELIFKKYLHLPDDVVNIFITALPSEKEPAGAMESAPRESSLLKKVDEALSKSPDLLYKLNQGVSKLNGGTSTRHLHYTPDSMTKLPVMVNGDRINVGFGSSSEPDSYLVSGKVAKPTASPQPQPQQPIDENVPLGAEIMPWRRYIKP